MVDNTLEGVLDVLVTGAFHSWFQAGRIVEISAYYGITRQNLIDYALNELGYGEEGDDWTIHFGEEYHYEHREVK